MLPDDTTTPFTIADVVHLVATGAVMSILPFALQLTVSVGAGIAATVTVVDPEPVPGPASPGPFDGIVPAVGLGQGGLLLALETNVPPGPAQTPPKPVAAGGAPLSG